ncbi:MAG: LysR family transcriptional regulator [Clostridia bacterium]|nr:LysR family transcriptional regulator [Clostridia bacterium]
MPELPLRYTMSLRIHREKKCFGTGVAQLLRTVQETHSLRAATMRMDMAYSKAWSIIKTAEEQLGFKLLNATTGGKGGGGATLTPEAEKLLADYENFEQEMREAADALFEKYFSQYE